MSCKKCEELQEELEFTNVPDDTHIYYFRVGNGDVAVIACEKHAAELKRYLQLGQRACADY